MVENASGIIHQFGVEGGDLRHESPNFPPHATQRYTLPGLKAGTYRIVCNTPGHREGGMVATLTVR